MLNSFRIQIASPFDRENLVAEIYYKDEYIAEISHENDLWQVDIYMPPNTICISVPLDEFQKVLEDAKLYLLGKL